MYDFIIRNARIIDGAGSPWQRGDVAVSGEKIAAVGRISSGKAGKSIDAEDMVVCPGFIEIHGHSDATLLINPLAESSIHQGVTTECTGNCGHSLFPVNSNSLDMVRNQFTSFVPEYDVSWNSLKGLKEKYESTGAAVNIVPLIGHNTVRAAVKGTSMGKASQGELREMAALVEQSMIEGAGGFSTGLEYPPGSASDTDELIALCQVTAEYRGLYATHIRNRDLQYLDAVKEAVEIGGKTGVVVQISHNVAKIGAPDGVMSQVLEKIELARREGIDVAFDVGAYLGGQTTPLASLPPWAFDGGIEKTLGHLSDPETREKMKRYEYPIWRIIKLGMWDKVRLAAAQKNSRLVGMTFAEIAAMQHKDPYDVLFDLLLSEGAGFYDVMWEGEIYRPEDRDLVLRHPLSSVCCDGRTLAPYGPLSKRSYHHVYNWVPYLLRHHVRERNIIGLEEAVRKVTSLPAKRLGLADRGLIRQGLAADLVVFDPDTIEDRATLNRPHEYPVGIHYVLVNGKLALDKGRHTGALPGKVLTRNTRPTR